MSYTHAQSPYNKPYYNINATSALTCKGKFCSSLGCGTNGGVEDPVCLAACQPANGWASERALCATRARGGSPNPIPKGVGTAIGSGDTQGLGLGGGGTTLGGDPCSAVCAKSCQGLLDLGCTSAKFQCNCGGDIAQGLFNGCIQIPGVPFIGSVPCWTWIVLAGLAMLVLIKH